MTSDSRENTDDSQPGSHILTTDIDWQVVAEQIVAWCLEQGFDAAGIADLDLVEHQAHLDRWLDRGYQGEMSYLERHGDMRSRPELLHPGTRSLVVARIDYLNPDPAPADILDNPEAA